MEREIERKVKKHFGKEGTLKDIERLLGGAQRKIKKDIQRLENLRNGFVER